MDHRKVILCPLMNAVTFIEQNTFRTYRFSTISKHGCSPEHAKSLEHAHAIICSYIKNSTV